MTNPTCSDSSCAKPLTDNEVKFGEPWLCRGHATAEDRVLAALRRLTDCVEKRDWERAGDWAETLAQQLEAARWISSGYAAMVGRSREAGEEGNR